MKTNTDTALWLENLRYIPGEIIWLEDSISELNSHKDPAYNELIESENARLLQCRQEMQAAIDIINSVEAPMLHKVLEMRYLHGMGWNEIARDMPGAMSGAGYKQMVYCSDVRTALYYEKLMKGGKTDGNKR